MSQNKADRLVKMGAIAREKGLLYMSDYLVQEVIDFFASADNEERQRIVKIVVQMKLDLERVVNEAMFRILLETCREGKETVPDSGSDVLG